LSSLNNHGTSFSVVLSPNNKTSDIPSKKIFFAYEFDACNPFVGTISIFPLSRRLAIMAISSGVNVSIFQLWLESIENWIVSGHPLRRPAPSNCFHAVRAKKNSYKFYVYIYLHLYMYYKALTWATTDFFGFISNVCPSFFLSWAVSCSQRIYAFI
jgi:hypothetical protein